MSCPGCTLRSARREDIVNGQLVIFEACVQCGRKVTIKIYPWSGGHAEMTEYRCKSCGAKKRRQGRPKPEEMSLYEVESDWRR